MLSHKELIADSIAHQYGSRPILTGVYLNCKCGEVLGVLGRNGCGKSTLLNIIYGKLKANYRHIKINNVLTQKPYTSGELAYLPQSHFFPSNITTRAAIELFCSKRLAQVSQIDVILKNMDKKVSTLSGGEQRLIECYTTLYSDATFVLLDEPFSQISPINIEELKQHINILKKEKGFILTDHYYQQILDISDRILLLNNGSNYTINSPDDLITHGYINHYIK